jgi:hypothetical protein
MRRPDRNLRRRWASAPVAINEGSRRRWALTFGRCLIRLPAAAARCRIGARIAGDDCASVAAGARSGKLRLVRAKQAGMTGEVVGPVACEPPTPLLPEGPAQLGDQLVSRLGIAGLELRRPHGNEPRQVAAAAVRDRGGCRRRSCAAEGWRHAGGDLVWHAPRVACGAEPGITSRRGSAAMPPIR